MRLILIFALALGALEAPALATMAEPRPARAQASSDAPPGGRQAQSERDADRCAKDPNPDIAIASCTRAIDSGHFGDANLAALFYDRGLNYQGQRDYDMAIRDYDQAIGLNPNLADAYYNRGVSYYRKNDDAHAIADLTQAISLKANFAAAYRSLGDVYQFRGDDAHAIEDYQQAIRLNPRDAEAYNDRGTSYVNKGFNDDRAIEDFNRAIELEPNFPVAFVNRGTAYANKGDDLRAIQDFTQAIQLDPNLALAYNNRGIARSNQGEYALALQDFDRASLLNPTLAEPFYNRGRARFDRARYVEAAADFAAAAARAPDDLYYAVWTYMARTRAGQKPDSVLPAGEDRPDLAKWPGPVVALYQGGMDAQALLKAAEDPDASTQRSQLCEAHFFLGEYALLGGDRGKARSEFQAAIAACPRGFDEYTEARTELARMTAPRP